MLPVGILLAAGRGRRFDPTGQRNKLLATLAGESVVVASARVMLATLPQVLAVVRDDDGVADALRAAGCAVTVCPGADSGMGASLAHALRQSLPAAQGWLIALGDMPYIAPSTIAALSAALAAGAEIAIPVFAGQRGNPVAFSAVHRDALLALSGDQGARAIVRANPVVEVLVDDAGILRDVDVPDDVRGE